MLRVFTSFSGYDSQCLALDRLGIDYDLVGWSEIDKYAIMAHNAIFPQYKDRNFGDITKIDWNAVPDFDLFTYSSPCFVAGTLVLADRGYIPIEEVKVGDMVLTHKNRYQRVLRTGSKVSNDLYRIKGMSFDEIVCTGNHPFYVRETLDNQAEWVQASRISTDNYVCVLRKNKYNMFWWVRPKSIEPIEGETETVFNLEVETDNSYTANDVIVHNCQDFSTAGLQRGGEKGSGTRSSLLWECERAIAAKRPKYLLMENVAALVSDKFIKLFNKWQRTLESYGYRNFAKVLNAKDYGVPQNRERIFVVSILDEAARYYFPQPIPLKKRLKDVLEPVVDECYYINDIQVQKVLNSSFAQERNRLQSTIAGACLARDYKDPKLVCVGSLQGGVWDARNESTKRVYDPDGIAPTQNCCEGGGLQTKIVEPTAIQQCGDYGNGYYKEKDVAFTLMANPMSDRQQLVKEPIK